MATIELGPGGQYSDYAGARSLGMRRVLLPAIRWSAVLAGVAVGISIQLALSLLGVATGLSSIDVTQNEGISATAPLAWAAISMLVSAFIGGYVAARLSSLKRKVDGVLHGAVSWAVTTLLFATLATSVSGSLLSGIFNTMAPAAQSMASAGTSGSTRDSALGALLRSQGGSGIDPATMQRLQDDIRAGRREDATSLLQDATGMERSRAAGVVDQALILSGSPERASPGGRAAANRAVETASSTAWAVFAAVALSLVLGIVGGLLGAMGARRTSWASGTAGEAGNAP